MLGFLVVFMHLHDAVVPGFLRAHYAAAQGQTLDRLPGWQCAADLLRRPAGMRSCLPICEIQVSGDV
jgi:hypothetical protein